MTSYGGYSTDSSEGSDSKKRDQKARTSVNLKQLIRKRGVCKGKLTNFRKFIDKINKENLTAEQLLEIEMRLDYISSAFQEYDNYQNSIETLSTDADKEALEREQFEISYFQTTGLGKSLLRQAGTRSGEPESRRNVPEPSESIKYPDIPLPSFSGDLTNWIEFRDTFDALINQSNLKAIQKFKYLKGCLKNSALEVVSYLEYSEESYPIAWKLLCERYNNPKVLIYNHLRALFHIDPVSNTAPALRGLADNISKHLRTLKSMNINTEGWDLLVIFFLGAKLEKSIQQKWEEKINSRDLPKLQDFKSFLRAQADLQDSLCYMGDEPRAISSRKALVTMSSSSAHNGNTKVIPKYNNLRNQCPQCKEGHYLNQCPKFLALNESSRIRIVKKIGVCFNCLSSSHILANCRSSNCKICKGKHHTLLHLPQITNASTMPNPPSPPIQIPTINLCTNTNRQVANAPLNQNDGILTTNVQNRSVLLSTAQVIVKDNNNKAHTLRILLDSGSQSNFITYQMAEKLNLPSQIIDLEVLGFNESVTKITKLCKVTIQSKHNNYTIDLSCFIVPNICRLPTYTTSVQLLDIPQRFKLADESFFQGGDVDMIVGAELFYQLMCVGQHRLGKDLPILQKTRLGWVVSGGFTNANKTYRVRCNFITAQFQGGLSLNENESRMEFSNDDFIQCEEIFKTHTRNSDGNFVVDLPLKLPISSLGQSRSIVYRRFKVLESKFLRDPEYKQKYVQVMRELIDSGHMIKSDSPAESCNYLSHHAVINPHKITTPLRVVFDASLQTSTGKSLNDIQYKGTIKQDDLANILLRFRSYKYVINADIEKMYRMIYINPLQQHLQCILWRENQFDPLTTYKLTTLSFGLKSAPYIATRCLLQLANECKNRFPAAAAAITSDFYMDDLLHGSDNEQLLSQTAMEVDNVLRGANFNLRKWKSNSPNILKPIMSDTSAQTKPNALAMSHNTAHKVLGLTWCSETDNLHYTLNIEPIPITLTKRKILSMTTAIFDPLCFLGPVLIIAKCFIQRLWKSKTDWDKQLPIELSREWAEFYNKLNFLNSLTIPRHAVISDYVTIELHGFADSSKIAYGAVIYLRSINRNGDIMVQILCAKSRIASDDTIPRLELRAAVLLAN